MLQAEELLSQQSQIVIGSRRAELDWGALRSVQVPNLVGLHIDHALLPAIDQEETSTFASVSMAMH